MQRILIFILIVMCTIISIPLISQAIEYTSLEVVNGQCTGYTNTITLNWIDSNTVEVSRSRRLSVGTDVVASYNVADLNYTGNNTVIIFYCDDDTWFIPFDDNIDPSKLAASFEVSIECFCQLYEQEVVPKCGKVVQNNEVICENYSCLGCCRQRIILGTTIFDGNGSCVLVNAKNLVY